MNENIDFTKAYVTLADKTVIQVLDANGEYDDAATAAAVTEYLEGVARAA